ncbi:ABC transporter ATP-binding protein [Paraburkholderia sp. MM6662-R1]|uniref:ABC transporter ATP-binding protein n=1 Tax=Paraburkholderia sp. MM6662-R1 TaxID=2991066 RepID=UPI003D249BC5
MNVLELSGVTKKYGDFHAMDDVSLAIEKGKTISILGPSGCGKTTTLRVIAGFTTVDRGTVRIAGDDVGRMKPYERNVGLLFQDYALFPHMTAAQNVAYGLRHRGYPKADVPAKTQQMLSLVRLESMGDRYPSQMSGGQQQRIGLARALATDPQIVLLDEPLSALDAKLRVELRLELKEILSSVGATTIVVTHDQEEALSLGDEVVVMKSGRIVQRGTPSDIYDNPKDQFVADFIGRSNWFSASCEGSSSNGLISCRTDDGIIVRALATKTAAQSGPLRLCVRPENVELAFGGNDQSRQTGDNVNVIQGTVADVAPLGADSHIIVQLTDATRMLVVCKNSRSFGSTEFAVGRPVAVTFFAEDVKVF